jgi:hypothetical protein
MVGVAIAFLGAGRARADARFEQGADHEPVPVARTRENQRSRITDIGADVTERDALRQRGDVLFDQV